MVLIFSIFSVWLVYSTAGKTSGCTQSVHGLYHSAYVYQIANGVIPPTNPYSIGMPASNYWGWYLLLALIMKLFNITSFESSLLVNTAALITFLTAYWIITGHFIRNIFARLVFCTVPFIMLTPVEIVKIIFLYMKDIHYTPPLTDLFPSVSILGMLLENRCLFLHKFLNFNGFPTGIALFTCLLVLVMAPAPHRIISPLLCALGALLTAFFHPASGMGVAAIAVAGGMIALVTFISPAQGKRSQFMQDIAPFAFMALGLAFALPYMMSLGKALGKGISLNCHLNTLLINILHASWTMLPSVLIYGFGLIRFPKLSRQGKLVFLVGVVLLLGLIFIIIYDNTQYQFAILSSIPTSLLLLAIYQSYFNHRKLADTYWYYPLLLLLLVLFTIGTCNIRIVISQYHTPTWAKRDPYVYNGQAIDLKVDSRDPELQNREKAYEWLRRNTPHDAYFLEYPLYAEAMLSSVITQRRKVVSSPNMYTTHIKHHEDLLATSMEFLASLRNCALTGETVRMLFDIKVPWPETIYVLIKKVGSYRNYHLFERVCLADVSSWISTAYANQHFVIYKVENPHYLTRK